MLAPKTVLAVFELQRRPRRDRLSRDDIFFAISVKKRRPCSFEGVVLLILRGQIGAIIRLHHFGLVSLSTWLDFVFNFVARRREVPYLHRRAAAATGHYHAAFALKGDAPDGFGRLAEFPDEDAGFKIPDLDAAIGTARDNAEFVELEGSDAVVVRGKTVDGIVGFQGPDTHGAVGAAGYED